MVAFIKKNLMYPENLKRIICKTVKKCWTTQTFESDLGMTPNRSILWCRSKCISFAFKNSFYNINSNRGPGILPLE